MLDPRVKALISRYALAKGDFLLKRKTRERFADPEVFAGWALERCGGDPLKAIQGMQRLRMPTGQRCEVLDVLRPLVTVVDLTKPRIVMAPR